MPAIIKKIQRTQVEQASNPVATRASSTSIGDLGQGITAVGGMFDEWQDEIDTADAKTADANFSELIRQELYADQTGFMYSQGADSLGRRGSVSERLEAAQAKMLEGLSPAAQSKAKSAIQARYQRALQTVDQHTAGQRRTYMDNASAARVTSSINDAIYNPDTVAQSLATTRQEILDQADRNGWSPEVTKLKLSEAQTATHSGIIERIANVDPERALAYLRDNKGTMLGEEVARLEGILAPRAREARGRRAGAAAAMGGVNPSTFNWSKYAVGGAAARSDSFTGLKPEYASRLAMLLQAADAELGEGALKITSAYRSVEKQAELYAAAIKKYGSAAAARKWVAPPGKSRHNSGTAVDFAGANGGLLRDANSREAKWIKENAARFGLDVPMSWEPWQVELSGSRGGPAPAPLAAQGGGLDSLLEIEDPDERAAAISEYNLRTGARQKQAEASRAGAEKAAFEMIEAGGNINDLPVEYRQHVGREAMSSLRTYQEKLAKGETIQTDDETYVQLSEMMAQSPEEFMRADPMVWRDKLDNSDFEYFVKQRSDMISGVRKAGREGPAVSSLRTAASTSLQAAGIEKGSKAAVEFESSLLRWSSAYAAKNGENPGPVELNERINQMLVPVFINGNKQTDGWVRNPDARAFQIDYDGDPLNMADDLRPEDIRDGALRLNDKKVSNDMIEQYAEGFQGRFNRAPTVQELIEGLIASGLF